MARFSIPVLTLPLTTKASDAPAEASAGAIESAGGIAGAAAAAPLDAFTSAR